MTEFRCCHGTPETGHSPTCPYSKDYWGPSGVQISRWGYSRNRGIDFHAEGLQRGPGSKYAKNLQAQAQIRAQSKAGGEGEAVGVDTQKGAARVREQEEKP